MISYSPSFNTNPILYSQLRLAHQRSEDENKRQLEQLRHSTDAEAERYRRRAEAEIADLHATISRLEVDLLRVSTQADLR